MNTLGRKRELLDEDKLELMLDSLEKATGTGEVVSQVRKQVPCCEVLPSHFPIPMLLHFYAPLCFQDQAESILMTKLGMQPTSASREVVADVYQYWIEKRAQYKKPLLRRFWPVTGADDTNPHLVFRPREKVRTAMKAVGVRLGVTFAATAHSARQTFRPNLFAVVRLF